MQAARVYLTVATIAICVTQTAQAPIAPALSNLPNPTVQTLINLGSDGVTVGEFRFFDFTFAGSSTTGGLRAASQVAVQSVTTGGFGIRFLSAWIAVAGNAIADVITYKVDLASPTESIGGIGLFSNGNAPLPAAGTFTSSSMSARTIGGAIAGRIISTYDDGHGTPADNTQPDVNVDQTAFAPQQWLSVSEAITTASGSPTSPGVAIASLVENTFTAVPEPRITA